MTANVIAAAPNGTASAKPRLLCVDDEPYVLEGMRDNLRRSFEVRTATSGAEGLEMLRRDPDAYAVVVSDMRMPRMLGSDFLRAARMIAPDAVRMLLTGEADLQEALRAVSGARLFRYLTKPCDAEELMRACTAALGQHRRQTTERALLEETLRSTVDALAEALAVTEAAAFGRSRRIKVLAGQLARAARLSNWWKVEVAAMLAGLGAATLPPRTAEKLYAGKRLSAAEKAMVERVPAITRQLLSRIPRLEGVLEILDTYRDDLPEDAPDVLSAVLPGARILRIAADYAELEPAGPSKALNTMRRRGGYDRALLETFAEIVEADRLDDVRELDASELVAGMTLADDVRGPGDELVAARGHRLTEALIERLRNFGDELQAAPVRVFATQDGP